MKTLLYKFTRFVGENWFKIALIILLFFLVVEIHAFNRKKDNSSWEEEYYKQIVCERRSGKIRLGPPCRFK